MLFFVIGKAGSVHNKFVKETLSVRRWAAQATTSEAVVENALEKQAASYDKLSAVRWPTRWLTSNTDRCMCERASSFLPVLLFLAYVP